MGTEGRHELGVACVYCGGRHRGPAEVRECWARSREPADGIHVVEEPKARAGAPSGPVLGRSVLVRPGEAPPAAWQHCERATGAGTDELERAWRERSPLVIEMEGDPEEGEVERRPVWSLSASFSFAGERRAHAIFSNSVDARHGTERWWLVEEAVKLGARAGGPADVVLPSSEPALLDGGPLEWQGPIARREGAGLGASGRGAGVVVHRMALLAGSLLPFGPNQTAAELAPDQLAAVTHTGGAARVIAPAGSGKTRVLTERARHLLRHWRLPGRAVTLVAFNKKAADEMKERTPDLPELQVRTLNALGLSLLGRSTNVTTIEEREVRSMLDGLVDLPRRANTDPAAAWLDALSAVRLGLRNPKEVEADFGGDVDGLPEVFERYRRLLSDRGQVDFDEQVYRAIEVLLTDPLARRQARAGCRVLLVDEFQDLTPAHLLFVRLLAGPDGAVFGVGDDDQTIYGYSGASPEWLIGFRRFFPSAGEHALEINYRCPPKVVESACNLLRYNRHRVEKTILPAPARRGVAAEADLGGGPRGGAGRAGLGEAQSLSAGSPGGGPEAQLEVVLAGEDALSVTVATVERLLSGGAAPSDVAVLTRVNSSLAGVQVALVHKGVPVQPAVDATYLSRSGVQAALGWLRLASSRPDRMSARDLAVAAKRPSRGLSARVIEWMAEQPSTAKLEALAGRLAPRDGEKVMAFLTDLELVRRSAGAGDTASTLRTVRDEVGLDRAMELLDGSRRRLDRSAQTDDLDALVALAALHPEAEGFEDWLRVSLRRPGSGGGVVLSTIHRVKGREWPHVVLHEVTDGLFPHRLAGDVEEERRVFHVGLTRCSVSVHIVAGGPPSVFIEELTGEASRDPRRSGGRREQGWAPGRPGARQPDGERGRGLEGYGKERQGNDGRRGVERLGNDGRRGGERPGNDGRRSGEPRRTAARQLDGAPGPHGRGRDREAERIEKIPPEVVEKVRRALRSWRSAQAARERKPAFVFLHDRTVEALAERAPATMVALSRIPGIGPAKLDAYGDELLALIAEAVAGAEGNGSGGAG